MSTTQTCSVCETPLEADGTCRECWMDADEARRYRGAWYAYVEKASKQLSAIAETAQHVCDEAELEVIGADLLGWSEERTASFLGLTPAELKARRNGAHDKIRAGIPPGRVAELTRRRR
jgi:hypothetical protein